MQNNLNVLNNKVILKFLLKCVIIYLTFIGLGLVLKLDPFFSEIFRKRNNARFKNRIENVEVKFQKYDNKPFDTNIHMKYSNPRKWTTVDFKLDSWYTAYIPKALLISLVLATTYGSIKRKAIALVLGFVLTSFFTFLVLYSRIYIMKVQAQQQILFDYANTFFDRVMVFMHNNFTAYGWINFILPLFAWLIVSVRKNLILSYKKA